MFEKRAWRLANTAFVLLALLTVRIIYWQMIRADELQPLAFPLLAGGLVTGADDELNQRAYQLLQDGGVPVDLSELPQPLVQRMRVMLENITRGSIYDRQGRVLAYDERDAEGEWRRVYNLPEVAPVSGYITGLRLGLTGVERSHNAYLLGLHRVDTQIEQVLKAPVRGSDVILTIDGELQAAAAAALQGRRGAIVILDGQDGAVLAMASAPGYDPNRMIEPEYAASLVAGCDAGACPAPLLNRATQALFVPGSTWKTASLIAGLDSGQLRPGMNFDFGKPRRDPQGRIYYVYEVDGGVIPDPNHEEARLSLEMSYAKSANAAFARIGDEMPAQTLIDYAHRLGMGGEERFPFEIPVTASQLANDEAALTSNNLLRAATAIGQGELQVTPLSMARMALAVVHDGDMPLPYLVDTIRDPNGQERPGLVKGRTLQNLMRPETARQVRSMMELVVTKGYGSRAAVPGLTVGGKTGTAQLGEALVPHAWFLGFAQDGERTVVMAILVENGGEGSQAAAPIFATLAKGALRAARKSVQAPPVTPTPLPPTPIAPAPTAPGVVPTAQITPVPGETTPVAVDEPMQPDIPYKPGQAPFFDEVRASCPEFDEVIIGTGQFGWPSKYQYFSGGKFVENHPGADFGTPVGTQVYAADAGMVIYAGWTSVGYGNTVVIDHGNGFWTLYAHLSQISTTCGAAVDKGQRVAMSGNTGNSSGPHLHFEVRVAAGYVDPLKVLPVP
jgi:peptidoglycan glycosyltransferase